ncbi:HNH endonuclease [Williamsia limnetica]|uniref:HNH endonuclease n=1 Tax=Williamsia limnetica TaxID=882452 RepID=A0A318RF80_WILLI|nr:HNH endonuclease signature motif containing protein [Williamsia limnetica]PYE14059.1 HNH endonuclease [Williamsia limnetica]
MSDRPPIPAELERALMIEAGFRCAIPTCRTVFPLEIEHIEDYSVVLKHEFGNMIVLCANCHRLKGTGPRSIDRKALRQIKSNLGIVNQRYNDTERRILEHFAEHGITGKVELPNAEVLFRYLLKDGILKAEEVPTGFWAETEDGKSHYMTRGFELTDKGKDLVSHLMENRQFSFDSFDQDR